MDARTILSVLCLVTATYGCASFQPLSTEQTSSSVGTPDDIPIEDRILEELNLARTDPAGYARVIEHRLDAYDGKEGKRAIRECIRALRETKPLRPLTHSDHVALAARDHVMDQGFSGRIGHEGSDGSDPFERIDRYVETRGSAENISYGLFDPRDVVVELLIDDGVPDRGHRINILDPHFEFVGIATGPHIRYRHMVVMDFTHAYEAW